MNRAVTGHAAATALTLAAARMSESDLQRAVTGMADWMRVTWHHETDSRKSKGGLPDLVLVGRRCEFWELKRETERLRPEQAEWLAAIAACEGITGRVVRPSDLIAGRINEWMKGIKG